MNKYTVWILVLVIFIRLYLIILPSFRIDMNSWQAWSARLIEVTPIHFYSPNYFADYFPGYLYMLWFMGKSFNLLFPHLSILSLGFEFYLKFFTNIFDMATAYYIYKIVSNYQKTLGLPAAIFYLANPALIFNSSVWGQIDSILTLFLVLAVYYLKNNSLVLSSLIFGVAFLIKPQAIAIFPIFALFFITNFTAKNLAKLVLPFLFVVFVISLPFFPNKPFTGLIDLVLKTASQYAYTSLFAYNFWGSVGFWINDSQQWNRLSYQAIGYILFSAYWIAITYFYLKRKLSLYALATLALLGFYFLPTRVHERYLYPAIVFLIFIASKLRSHLLLLLATILNIIHFLNLYYVYVYYNEFYLKLPRLLYNPILYNFLDNNGKILSIISTIIFVLISINIIKSNVSLKED